MRIQNISVFFLFALCLFTQNLLAAGEVQPSVVQLNPATIRTRILQNNLSVIKSMNQVLDAKDKVNIARGNLLPSLGLSGMIPHSGSFLLSAVNILVPFLLPSNWAEYYAEKELFAAEKISYRVMQLNTYSSALSMYYTYLSDEQIQGIYQAEYEDLQKIYEIQKLRYDIGLCSEEDLLQSQAQAQMAGVKASSLVQLNDQEIASIRSALALPLSTVIAADKTNVEASGIESLDIQTATNKVNSLSLERRQVQNMIKAAEGQKWSKTFGFLGSASLSSAASGGNDASFSKLNSVGSINLGFALIPAIQLSERNVKEMKLQLQSVEMQNAQNVESTLKSLTEVKKQFDLALGAENEMRKVYQAKLLGYDIGTVSLLEVIMARNQMIESAVSRVKANLGLNLLRISLHRMMLTSDFTAIEECKVTSQPKSNSGGNNNSSGGFLGGLIGGNNNNNRPVEKVDLDQACRNSAAK